MKNKFIWNIIDKLVGQQFSNIGFYAVLILNRPIHLPDHVITNIWNEASFRVTVDGGTKRWYDFVSATREKSKLKQIHPDLVSGDLDSIQSKTLQYCQENGVNIVRTPDQDKTDFTKVLDEVIKYFKKKMHNVIVISENSGRLDHIMSNLNTLYSVDITVTSVFLLASDCVSWLLRAGSHHIHIPQGLIKAQAPCGLIPLGGPCIVSTSGLKWDLNNIKIEFGGLISSSNTYSVCCKGVILIETDSTLLFTASLIFDNINNDLTN